MSSASGSSLQPLSFHVCFYWREGSEEKRLNSSLELFSHWFSLIVWLTSVLQLLLVLSFEVLFRKKMLWKFHKPFAENLDKKCKKFLLCVNIRTCIPVKYFSSPRPDFFYWLETSCDFCSLACAFLILFSSVNAEILKDC